MKILTFSAYYTPEIAASLYLTLDMHEGFAQAGHDVELYVPYPCRGIDNETRNEYKKKKTEKKYDGHLTVHRFALYKEGKNTLSRALRYFFLNCAFFMRGIFHKADVIFAQSTPPTQGMMCALLSVCKRIPFVYNLQDIFPDSLVNSGITHKGSLIWRIGRAVEKYTYKRCEKIIVISEDFKKNLLLKGVPEEKIAVVPNWADTGGVYPVERRNNKLFEKYRLDPQKFYIAYSGNIGYSQNIDMLLDTAKQLSREMPQIVFVLIGDGVAKDETANSIKRESIDNVIMLPFQPYEDIANVFSLGDVGLIISKPGIGNNSVPSKTWSIMAAERPILASFDTDSELCRLIKEVGCGVCVPAGDAEEFKNAVKTLYENKDLTMGKKGSAYISEVLSKEKCVREYTETVESVKNNKKN